MSGVIPTPRMRLGKIRKEISMSDKDEKDAGCRSLNGLVRQNGRRVIGSQRARVLRKRGESVWFEFNMPSGKARYSWKPNANCDSEKTRN